VLDNEFRYAVSVATWQAITDKNAMRMTTNRNKEILMILSMGILLFFFC
jgi:hypothetical protein